MKPCLYVSLYLTLVAFEVNHWTNWATGCGIHRENAKNSRKTLCVLGSKVAGKDNKAFYDRKRWTVLKACKVE